MINKTPETPPEKKMDKPVSLAAGSASRPPASLISSYRKRQQTGPFIIWSIVILLVFVGLILLVVWLTSPSGPKFSFFATETPTPTITPSPTNTFTPTATSTETPTATITPSPTPSAPFKYVVQDGDSLAVIAEKFNLGDTGIPLILLLNPPTANGGIDPTTQIVYPGLELTIPNPGMQLPTETPIPENIARGTKIDYTIQAGDTIAAIASKFNSTAEDIIAQNNITDPNKISVGQLIVVRINLVTPTITPQPTITPGPSVTPPSPFTVTPEGGIPVASATPTP